MKDLLISDRCRCIAAEYYFLFADLDRARHELSPAGTWTAENQLVYVLEVLCVMRALGTS